MNWAAAGVIFAEFARKKPALATVVVLLGLVGYGLYAHFGPRYAHGEDLAALESTVSSLISDFADLKDEVKAGRLDALEGQLFQARVDQCRAESNELKEVYAKRVTSLLTDYREAGGGELNLPRCDDL